jgi:RNA polymerase sigma factor (sigma-70 family)
MTTIEAYDVLAPIAIVAAQRLAPRWLRTDPDFLQDVRLRVWRAARFRDRRYTEHPAPFATVIGRNAARDHLARRRPLGYRDSIVHRERTPRIASHGDLEPFAIQASPEPDPFASEELLAIVGRADLTRNERASVLHGFLDDMTHHEIGKRLAVTKDRSKRIRVNALAKIKRAIA